MTKINKIHGTLIEDSELTERVKKLEDAGGGGGSVELMVLTGTVAYDGTVGKSNAQIKYTLTGTAEQLEKLKSDESIKNVLVSFDNGSYYSVATIGFNSSNKKKWLNTPYTNMYYRQWISGTASFNITDATASGGSFTISTTSVGLTLGGAADIGQGVIWYQDASANNAGPFNLYGFSASVPAFPKDASSTKQYVLAYNGSELTWVEK